MSALGTALFLGAVVGSIYALSAFGLVLTYRASGTFNFAHGAVGMLFAFVFYQLVQGGRIGLVAFDYDQTWRLPTGIALLAVVGVLAPAFGWMLDRILFRPLRDAGEVVKIVATIGLLVALQGVAGVMWGAATTLTPSSIFSPRVLTAGGFRASVEQIAAILLTVALALGLLAFLRYSALGVRMRAVVDRADLAELAGIDSGRVSAFSWAVGTSFAALSGILLAPFFGSLEPITLTFFVVAATAAAIAGRLESFPLTLAGAYGIGMAQILIGRYASGEVARQLRPAVPFLVLFGLLFLPQWRRRPTDRWTVPPLPPVLRDLSPRDLSARIGIVTAVALVAPFVLGPSWQLQLARVPAMALIFLSLVVVSGFGGQVSLCQAALAGFGAFATAHLAADWGVPFFAAVLLGGIAVVPIGIFLSLRAVNLSPLFLGFATLAFGAVMDEVAFNSKSFSGGLSGVVFDRPGYLQSPRVFYIAALALFGFVALLVQNLRRSKTGLALAAMRDSEVGLGSLGVDVARLKLIAFSISALIAGIGGAMFSAADGLATPFSYFKLQSLLFLALAVIGGIGSWLGAFAGAVIFQLIPAFVHEPFVQDSGLVRAVFRDSLEALLPVLFGLGAIGLARNPHGLVEQIRVWFTPPPRIERKPPPVEAIEPKATRARPVTFRNATLFHRPDCVLAENKKATAVRRGTKKKPCPVCEPAVPRR
ncbi:MAG TPA: ABC transporter permease [Actinomycetota bacterium]|jgi:branched-chain amino acid transport system permease protein|nr:ABC transporter permease [Actinomycetota bacterium]